VLYGWCAGIFAGGRWGTRTPDPKLRRLVLCPPELIALRSDEGCPLIRNFARGSGDQHLHCTLKPEERSTTFGPGSGSHQGAKGWKERRGSNRQWSSTPITGPTTSNRCSSSTIGFRNCCRKPSSCRPEMQYGQSRGRLGPLISTPRLPCPDPKR
jgi:hypothetical protein